MALLNPVAHMQTSHGTQVCHRTVVDNGCTILLAIRICPRVTLVTVMPFHWPPQYHSLCQQVTLSFAHPPRRHSLITQAISFRSQFWPLTPYSKCEWRRIICMSVNVQVTHILKQSLFRDLECKVGSYFCGLKNGLSFWKPIIGVQWFVKRAAIFTRIDLRDILCWQPIALLSTYFSRGAYFLKD